VAHTPPARPRVRHAPHQPSVPTLTRKEIIERDTTRKESRAAAIAPAAAADGGDGGGDGGGGDAASGQGDEDEGPRRGVTRPPSLPRRREGGRRRRAGQGAAGGEKEKVSLLWAALSPGTIAMVALGMKHSDYTNLCAHRMRPAARTGREIWI
jgi:hypothetical protein